MHIVQQAHTAPPQQHQSRYPLCHFISGYEFVPVLRIDIPQNYPKANLRKECAAVAPPLAIRRAEIRTILIGEGVLNEVTGSPDGRLPFRPFRMGKMAPTMQADALTAIEPPQRRGTILL